jgi:hypothetical protein
MSDILSGGVIDGSTSGPIPSNTDDRKRDIISEQKESQRQNAIGGTETPPTPTQPQQIPEPPQVAPPLPVIPSFDFNISGSLAEETREVARQATIDVIKNVTINGQGPSIDGSSISFNIPQERPANEVFVFQGIAITQGSQNPSVTDLRVSPPSQAGSLQLPEPRPSLSQPAAQINEPIGEKQDRENNERAKRDREIRSNLGLGNESPLDKYEGVSFGERQDAELSERRERDKEIRRNLGLGEVSPLDEETDVAKGFKAAEEKSRQRRESDPNFDRESDVRQRGERYSDFKERQETLKQERSEQVEATKAKTELSKRLKEGAIAETPSGMVPVALTRADGQKKILAYLASDFVGVVEGGASGERLTALPSEDSYYEAGGGLLLPFQLIPIVDEDENPKIFVVYGEVSDGISGGAIQGMSENNDPQYLIAPSNNDFVYVILTFNEFRQIDSKTIGYNSAIPENTRNKKHDDFVLERLSVLFNNVQKETC